MQGTGLLWCRRATFAAFTGSERWADLVALADAVNVKTRRTIGWTADDRGVVIRCTGARETATAWTVYRDNA